MKKNRLFYKTILCYLARFVPQAFRKFFSKRNAGGEGRKPSGFLYLFFSKQTEPKARKKVSFEQRQQYNKEFLEKRGLGHTFVREPERLY